MALTAKFLLKIRDCIVKLSKLYVDPTVTDYSFLFIKQRFDEVYGGGRLFPAVLTPNIFKNCQNISNIVSGREIDIFKAKTLLKEFKTAICKMTQTPNGAIWARRWGTEISYSVDRYDTYDKMQPAMQDEEDRLKTYKPTEYTGVRTYKSNNRLGHYGCGDEYPFVGITANEGRRDKYDDKVYYSYWYNAYIKIINDYAVWNPLGIKSKLKIYRYVSTDIDMPDKIDQEGEYWDGSYYPAGDKFQYIPYTFGLPEGFSIEDKR